MIKSVFKEVIDEVVKRGEGVQMACLHVVKRPNDENTNYKKRVHHI